MVTRNHFNKGDPFPAIPDDGKLQLISMRFCPFAERIHLVLETKSIPHHVINVNLTEKPEWLTKFSALGKVPALRLPNEPDTPSIHESTVIADYLDEKYPQVPLYPTDPLAKALDRLLIERFGGIWPHVYKIILDGANQEGHKAIFDGLDFFETVLKNRGTPYFGGNTPNMVDYMSIPFFERILAVKYFVDYEDYEIKADRFPLLIKWNATILEDPAVKNNYISAEFHAEFFKLRKAGTPDNDFLFK